MLDKTAVVNAIRTQLSGELDAAIAATQSAREEATGDESRPENQYDTRALEASYLAAGQGERLAVLRRLAAWFESLDTESAYQQVQSGALVQLSYEDGRERHIFVAPIGGTRVIVDETEVAVISPESLLGRTLLGLEAGDGAELDGPMDAEVEIEGLA